MIILLLFLALGMTQPAVCSNSDLSHNIQEFVQLAISDTLSENGADWLLLPIIFKSPDTGWAGGVLPQLVFRYKHSTNPSFLRLDAYYTQKKQYHAVLRSSNWIRNDAIFLSGQIAIKDWPMNYFGIGNQTGDDLKISIREKITDLQSSVDRRIGDNILAGVGYRYRHSRIAYPVDSELIFDPQGNGSQSLETSGITAGLTYDSRDNHFYPSNGMLARISFFKSMGLPVNDSDFSTLETSIIKYQSIRKNQVLALQGVVMISQGNVPFRLLPSLGNNLRGYSSTRYVGNNLLAARLEYRFVPAYWRLGFTVFAGIGDVFTSPEDLAWNQIKYTVGAGIRFVFSRKEKIHVRMDYGFGRNSSGNYIDIMEAF